MIGKTSLALAIANSYSRRKVVYVDLVKVNGIKDLIQRSYFSLPKSLIDKAKESLDLIGVKIGSVALSFKIRPTIVFENIIKSICKDTILILDEAQDLKQGINYIIPIFHRLMNTCNTLSIIFTRSAIGLLKTLLEQKGGPLAGRKPTEVILKPWSEDIAKEYLIKGLEECKANLYENEINETIREIGTKTGWLNIYGVNRCIIHHNEALNAAIEEAKGIAKEEINNIIEGKRWKKKALKILMNGSSWSELLNETNVSTQTLSNFLNRLNRLFLINKEESKYYISDPVYKKAILVS